MNDYIWMSVAMGRTSSIKRFTQNFADDPEQLEKAILMRRRNDAGESIPAEFFPAEIYGAPGSKPGKYKLPNLFFAGSFWVVSGAAADVIRQFDLGGGGLYPVKVLQKDRVTPVEGNWFCINFGNVKQAFLPHQSFSEPDPTKNLWYDNIRHGGVKGWIPSPKLEDNEFAVTNAATVGPDIWIDQSVGDAFFLSAALGDALKKAKADKGFDLLRCRVVVE
jgi:hypothetical protein